MIAIAAGLGLLCGCTGGSPEGLTILRAGSISLYEGLPHAMYEPESLAAEKKAKPTIELHGFSFYRQALAPSGGDQAKLKASLGDAGSYSPYSGEKKCGGFHPDYAVEWTVAGEPYACLICFGCGEIKVFGPKGEATYDVPREARERLKILLAPHRRNRPVHD